MRAYSMDLRERVFADCQAGMTTPVAAEKYSVSPAWVRRLKPRHKATGSLAPRPPSPGRPSKVQPHDARVRELVRDDPDATLAELRTRLGITVSLATLCNYLRRIKLSFKKKSSGRPSRTGRT
jgi:transposase